MNVIQKLGRRKMRHLGVWGWGTSDFFGFGLTKCKSGADSCWQLAMGGSQLRIGLYTKAVSTSLRLPLINPALSTERPAADFFLQRHDFLAHVGVPGGCHRWNFLAVNLRQEQSQFACEGGHQWILLQPSCTKTEPNPRMWVA